MNTPQPLPVRRARAIEPTEILPARRVRSAGPPFPGLLPAEDAVSVRTRELPTLVYPPRARRRREPLEARIVDAPANWPTARPRPARPWGRWFGAGMLVWLALAVVGAITWAIFAMVGALVAFVTAHLVAIIGALLVLVAILGAGRRTVVEVFVRVIR